MGRETQATRRGAKQRVKERGSRAAAAATAATVGQNPTDGSLGADLARGGFLGERSHPGDGEPNQLPEDGGVSWADVKLFFFTWAALVALFGLGGYLLYEDEYQRQLQEHLMNKGLSNSKEGRWEEAIQSYTAVLDKDREHSVALTNRGMAYASTGQVRSVRTAPARVGESRLQIRRRSWCWTRAVARGRCRGTRGWEAARGVGDHLAARAGKAGKYETWGGCVPRGGGSNCGGSAPPAKMQRAHLRLPGLCVCRIRRRCSTSRPRSPRPGGRIRPIGCGRCTTAVWSTYG